MKTFSLFLEDTGYQGGTAPIVDPPKVDSEDDPMKEEDTDDIDEVSAIRSVNKELADIALDDLDEALEKIQEVLATIGVTFDQESAKSALGSSDQIEVALHDNPTDAAEPIAIYGKDDEGNEEPGELTLCIHKDADDYKAYLHIYFGEEKMRLSDLSLEDKDSDETEVTEAEEEDKDNPVDVVKMDIPLFIRMLEFAREDAVDDEQLHAVTERITKMAAEGNIITMAEYDKIVGASTEEQESKDPNTSKIKKTGHIEVYESKSKTLESFLQESSEDDSPQVVVYLKVKDVRSKVVKNKHAAHLVIKTEKADGIISITPVDTDEINKAKDQADTVKKDAKVKAKKKLENEAKNEAKKVATDPTSMMDEAPVQRTIHVTDKSGNKTDIQVKPNVGDATLLDMIAATRKKFPNDNLGYSQNGGMEEPLGDDEGQGIPPPDKLKEEDSAKVIGDIVKIASGPMKELPHGNDLHKVIDVQDGKLLIQPWDQETEKPFPLKNIKYPHSAVLVDAADITSHDLLGMDIRLKEEDGPDGENNEEDEEKDDDSLPRPTTH